MKMSDLRPASELGKLNGAKMMIYGPPGSAKTPLITTIDTPVLCATETGLLSMRDSGDNIATFEAKTAAEIKDFFAWVSDSNELKNFSCVCIDSFSHACEIILKHELENCKDGRKAYDNMATTMIQFAELLQNKKGIDCYVINKCITDETNSVAKQKPYYPGKVLSVKMPHLFDGVFYIDQMRIPGVTGTNLAIQTFASATVTARDRSGKLDDYEFPDIGQIIEKIKS